MLYLALAFIRYLSHTIAPTITIMRYSLMIETNEETVDNRVGIRSKLLQTVPTDAIKDIYDRHQGNIVPLHRRKKKKKAFDYIKG